MGDFNADGKNDWVLYRPSEGRFYIWYKDTGLATSVNWGVASDMPVPRDYDGDFITDVAVWRPTDGNWYILPSKTGAGYTVQWGANGDIPGDAHAPAVTP